MSSAVLVPAGQTAVEEIWRAAVPWCWQLDTNLLPVWIQKGIPPSLWDRCGPLKLYLYSNRRCGASSVVEAPTAMSATLLWNISVVTKVVINKRAPTAGLSVMGTAMFLYHCWRSAESASMTGCLLGQQGVFSLDDVWVLFRPAPSSLRYLSITFAPTQPTKVNDNMNNQRRIYIYIYMKAK